MAAARLSSIGRAMAQRCEAQQRQGTAVQSKGYEVNCCAVAEQTYAVALRSTDGQGEGMAEKSANVICEGKVVHRNDSLRQGFASDELARK